MKSLSLLFSVLSIIVAVYGQHASSCYNAEDHSRYGDKGVVSILPNVDMVCSSQGLTFDLCEEMEIKMIELRGNPKIQFNSTISMTFYNEDESEFVAYEANTSNIVKGPSQYFHVPATNIMSKVKKVNVIFPDNICGRTIENGQPQKIFIALIGRMMGDIDIDETIKSETDKDIAQEEIDNACNNEVSTVPLNFIAPAELRGSLYIDIQQIIKRNQDYMTKLGLGLKIFMKQENKDDINNECRGYLYISALNECDLVRTRYADYEPGKEFHSLPKYMEDVIRNLKPETLPATLTRCVSDLVMTKSSEDLE